MLYTQILLGSYPSFGLLGGEIIVGGEFCSPKELIRSFLAGGPGPARGKGKGFFSSWGELLCLAERKTFPLLFSRGRIGEEEKKFIFCFVREENSTMVVRVEPNCFVAIPATKPIEIKEGDIILFSPQ